MKPVDQEFTHQPEIGQPVALPAGMPEPDAYMFQHEETGLVQFVDAQQVEWGFEENNPRLKRIDAAYTAAQVQAMLAQGLAPGWQAVPVEPTRAMLDASIGVARNLSDWRNGLAAYRAMLATAPPPQAAPSSPTAVERNPLGKHEIHIALDSAGLTHHGLTLDQEVEIARVIEAAHGITAQQGGRT